MKTVYVPPRQPTGGKNSVIDISKKARQKLRARRYTEAKELFRTGLDMEPENPYLLSGMGDACRETEDFAEAERCYQALLELDEKNLFALRGLGDVYKKLNRHQEAIKLWERYLTLRPQDKHVMTRIADSCKVLALFERAEQAYQQILKIAPSDRFALTGLADLLHRMGQDAEAIATYEKVLKFDENELHILTIIGKLCWRVSDFEKAETYFRRALAVDPQNPYALYGLGNCYRWYRDYEKAIEIWQKILACSEGTQTLHTRMGDAFFNLNRLAEAEVSYCKALDFGHDAFAMAGLVCLLSVRREMPRAGQYFNLLIEQAHNPVDQFDTLVKRFIRSSQTEDMLVLLNHLLDTGQVAEPLLQVIKNQLNQSI